MASDTLEFPTEKLSQARSHLVGAGVDGEAIFAAGRTAHGLSDVVDLFQRKK